MGPLYLYVLKKEGHCSSPSRCFFSIFALHLNIPTRKAHSPLTKSQFQNIQFSFLLSYAHLLPKTSHHSLGFWRRLEKILALWRKIMANWHKIIVLLAIEFFNLSRCYKTLRSYPYSPTAAMLRRTNFTSSFSILRMGTKCSYLRPV